MEKEQDLKEAPTAPSAGQEEKEAVEEKEPIVEETKEPELPDWAKDKMSKLEEERDNYKQGMLKYKKLTLTPEEKKEEPEEEYPDWDETSKKFQKQTLSEAQKVAERKVNEVIEKNNEQEAISKFISDNPDAEMMWQDVVSNYNPKSGKGTINSILKDLKRAYTLTRIENGEFDKSPEKEATKNLANKSTVGKTTSKVADKGNDALSPAAIEMAKKMNVDLNKLAAEDLSKPATTNF